MFRPLDVVCRTLVFSAALLTAASCFGQAASGSINGYITDASSAVIANSKVSVTNEGTGATVQVTTSNEGFYTAANLPPGVYTVSAEQPGFSKLSREHVTLGVDAVVRIDLTLSPGNVSESMTVAARSRAAAIGKGRCFADLELQSDPEPADDRP